MIYDVDIVAVPEQAVVCFPVRPAEDGSVPDAVSEARGELVPLHHALQAVHTGPHDAKQDAWRAVDEARAALGYTASGPVTEVRLPYAR